MDDELRILHEAMVIKERLRVLAELQGTYWDELAGRGFEPSVAEQLLLEWSRHAYGITFRSLPEPAMDLDADLGRVLGGFDIGAIAGPARGEVARSASDADPSRVPQGEPWLQLVQEEQGDAAGEPDADASSGTGPSAAADDDSDDRAA